jgi:hypothetical protein
LPRHRRALFGRLRAAYRTWTRGRPRGRTRAAAGAPRGFVLALLIAQCRCRLSFSSPSVFSTRRHGRRAKLPRPLLVSLPPSSLAPPPRAPPPPPCPPLRSAHLSRAGSRRLRRYRRAATRRAAARVAGPPPATSGQADRATAFPYSRCPSRTPSLAPPRPTGPPSVSRRCTWPARYRSSPATPRAPASAPGHPELVGQSASTAVRPSVGNWPAHSSPAPALLCGDEEGAGEEIERRAGGLVRKL